MAATLIIVPAWNEERAIAGVVSNALMLCPDCDVLVVDDGSADETANVARKAGALVVRLPVNLGIGGAVQTGYRFALRHGYSYAVQMDGDGQHPAAGLQRLLTELRSQDADMVIGSRYLEGCEKGMVSSRARVAGGLCLAKAIHALTGRSVTDPTSGFRAVGARLIRAFASEYPSDYPEPISLLWAIHRGFRIAEVPVTMAPREHGNSSITSFKSLCYMVKVMWAMVLTRVYG